MEFDALSDCFEDNIYPERCEDLLDDMEVVGEGSSRVAVSDGEYIYKVSAGGVGPEDNLREVEIWNTSTDRIRDRLAPIVDHDPNGQWIQMPIASDVESASKMYSSELKNVLDENGLVCPDVRYIKENVGILDDKPVVIDYADCYHG